MKIILKYNTDGMNRYFIHGLPKGQSIVLIPTNFMEGWQEIFIRFRSSASEVGYMRCKKSHGTFYYFIKNKNTAVSTYGDDKLISTGNIIVQDFNEMFNYKKDKIKPKGLKVVAPRDISRKKF